MGGSGAGKEGGSNLISCHIGFSGLRFYDGIFPCFALGWPRLSAPL
jgi:hypothetical protein